MMPKLMEIFLASKNPGKLDEVRSFLRNDPVRITSSECIDLGQNPVIESGKTLEENALLKARSIWVPGRNTLGDDSGIFVDALPGELGVKTRRWGPGEHASDEEFIATFLKRMQNELNKKARFQCVLALKDSYGNEHIFSGLVEGSISIKRSEYFPPGLPFDCCFVPEGFDRVYALLPLELKNSTSHRGRALHKLRAHMATILPSLSAKADRCTRDQPG